MSQDDGQVVKEPARGGGLAQGGMGASDGAKEGGPGDIIG